MGGKTVGFVDDLLDLRANKMPMLHGIENLLQLESKSANGEADDKFYGLEITISQ